MPRHAILCHHVLMKELFFCVSRNHFSIHSPCYSFAIASTGKEERSSNVENDSDGTVTSIPRPVEQGEKDNLRETSLMLRIPEGRAAYLTLGYLLSLADDNRDGNNKEGHGKGGWIRMRQRRRRRQVHIVPPWNLPVPGSDCRLPSSLEAPSAEFRIRGPLHQSGNGIGGGGVRGGRGWASVLRRHL